jgi:hypothetical protein
MVTVVPSLVVDTHYYSTVGSGHWVLSVLNLLVYNANPRGTGSEL